MARPLFLDLRIAERQKSLFLSSCWLSIGIASSALSFQQSNLSSDVVIYCEDDAMVHFNGLPGHPVNYTGIFKLLCLFIRSTQNPQTDNRPLHLGAEVPQQGVRSKEEFFVLGSLISGETSDLLGSNI